MVVLGGISAALACGGGSLVMAPMLSASVKDEPPPSPSSDAGALQDMPNVAGRWGGRAQQSNGQSRELVLDVSVAGASLRARVNYPAQSCSGVWNLEPGASREWVGDERIASGTERCVENGAVHLRLTDAGGLEFDWREIGGRGMTAKGTLIRVPLRR